MLQLPILAELLFFSYSILHKHQKCPLIRSQMLTLLSDEQYHPDEVLTLCINTEQELRELESLVYNLNRIISQMIGVFSDPEKVSVEIQQELPKYTGQLKENIKSSITDNYISRLKCFQEWVYIISMQLKGGIRHSAEEHLLA